MRIITMCRILLLSTLVFTMQVAFGASSYTMHPLISDISNPTGTSADSGVVMDPNLVNPWGIAISAGSPFWISDAGTGLATVYSYTPPNTGSNNTSNPVYAVNTSLVVKVPGATDGTAPRVTGQIAGIGAFPVAGSGTNASFLFCTEDGTISGWNRGADATNAIMKVNNAGKAVYKGCTAAVTPNGARLYAANFAGGIDVFDGNWNPVSTGGGFADSNLTAGLAPFNIQAFGNKLVVTYAMPASDGVHDQRGAGNGWVDIFDQDGNLLESFSDPSLNSPWGLEIAPEFFGDFSFALLVGNFGDGHINAFDMTTGAYLGALSDSSGKPLAIPGLWALQFGNGKSGGDAKTLYFTAGINGEQHGLFGSITTP